MKHKFVTLGEDQGTLNEGTIQADGFSNRISMVQHCLRKYFATHLAETAALFVSYQELDLTDIGEAINVDRPHLANLVAAIDEEAALTEITTYRAEIESEFSSMISDGTDGVDTIPDQEEQR